MNVFEAVKESVATRQAAEMYGIAVRRNGMACCPFHKDKNPSMKLDKRFHCFGCQADGDVIDFVARFYDLGLKEAAEKLAADFGIQYDTKGKGPPQRASVRKKISDIKKIRSAQQHCFRVLSDYYNLLVQWAEEYRPRQVGEEWHPLFVEAIQKREYTGYLLDILLDGTEEEKAILLAEHGKEVQQLEQRISGYPASRAPGRTQRGRSHGAVQER